MKAVDLVEAVKRAGGVLALDGDGIEFRLPEWAAHFIEPLRQQKAEVIKLLQARGERVASFPHCPKCASYALYRRDNTGNYECQTCGLQEITEGLARRVQ
jgi:hypothetical protein